MDKSKLILIIAAVVVVISLGVAAFSVISMTKAINNMNVTEQETTEFDPNVIPLNERVEFLLTDPVIHQFTKVDSDGNKRVLSVSMEIGISLNTNEKDYDDVNTLMGEKEDIIRDRISTLLSGKSYDFMVSDNAKEMLKEDILETLKVTFNTESIIEVYFGDYLTSLK